MGVTPRRARRILAAYRERRAAALVHGHRGRRPTNATPKGLVADVVHLACTRYAGVNHTHLAELLAEREGVHIDRTILVALAVIAIAAVFIAFARAGGTGRPNDRRRPTGQSTGSRELSDTDTHSRTLSRRPLINDE